MQRQLGAVQPHEAFVKVPEITIAFWVIKILTTGMGETTSDFFVRSFDPPPVVLAAGVLLAISLGAQILSRRYSTWLYWLTVVLVSIFGTMVADILHILVGIPYLASTIGFGEALAVILLLWNRNEGTLSIPAFRPDAERPFIGPRYSRPSRLVPLRGTLLPRRSALAICYRVSRSR